MANGITSFWLMAAPFELKSNQTRDLTAEGNFASSSAEPGPAPETAGERAFESDSAEPGLDS